MTDARRRTTTTRFYDRISHVYDLIADAAEHDARESGEEMLAPAEGETVLEIGSGPGRSLIAFARRVGERGRVFGVDRSEGMARQARTRVESETVEDRAAVVVGDARRLPWRDGSFDAAFLSFTLELFSDADVPTVLAEIRRVLRPGGRFAVVHMASTDEHGRMERIYEWMHRHFPHFVDCRPMRARGAIERAGFEIDETRSTEIYGLPVDVLAARKA